MPMKKTPIWENNFIHSPLVVSTNPGGYSLVDLSIAFRDTFGYCVGCKTGGLSWR